MLPFSAVEMIQDTADHETENSNRTSHMENKAKLNSNVLIYKWCPKIFHLMQDCSSIPYLNGRTGLAYLFYLTEYLSFPGRVKKISLGLIDMIKELLTGCTWREELFRWPWLLILPDHSKSIMYLHRARLCLTPRKKKVKKRPYPNLKSAAPPQLNRQGSSQVSIQEDGDQGYYKQQLETISSSWRQGKYGSTVQSDGLAMI